MKIPAIKQLAVAYSLEQLRLAEAALAQGKAPNIEVPGCDNGEQLTHAFAAAWVKERIEVGEDLQSALRAYTEKVRGAID